MLGRVMELRDTLLREETRRKLVSWWRGVDDEPALHPLVSEPQGIPGDAAPAARPSPSCSVVHRIAVAEHLWGRGNIGPGDSDFIRELGVQLGLNKEKTLGFLGIGLAGAARALVTDSEVWVTAFEANPEIAKAANEQNMLAGMAKKITVTACPFDTLALPARKFNDIIAKDVFARVENKDALCEQIAGSLKPGGSFLFAEYVAPGGMLTPEDCETYFCKDFGPVYPLADGQSRTLVQAHGLDLRVEENVTSRYAEYATAGWANLRGILDRLSEATGEGPERFAIMRAVADEASIWANRIDAFRNGKLAVYRYLAMSPSGPA